MVEVLHNISGKDEATIQSTNTRCRARKINHSLIRISTILNQIPVEGTQ